MSGNFEGKKHAYRQTQDGIVVSFVVHPSDISSAIAMAPLGTRFMVAFAEIGDDEKPIEVENSLGGASPSPPFVTVPRPQANEAGISKPKKRFEDYPLSQQCALLCDDPDFWKFLSVEFSDRWGEGTAEHTSDRAADTVRALCNTKSRSEFDESGQARGLWRSLQGQYQNWLTSQRYADTRR